MHARHQVERRAPVLPPPVPTTSLLASPGVIYETGVIFGELLYVHYHRGTGAATTSGKALDITNVVTSGHVSYNTSTELVTKRFNISAAGVMTPIDTRVGFYLADQLTATEGFEVLYGTNQLRRTNLTTGAVGTVIGTLPFSPCAVYGDIVNNYIYALSVDGLLNKYNHSWTLIASLQLPAPDDTVAWRLRKSDIKESQGMMYVRFTRVTYEVRKDMSGFRELSGFMQPYPGYAVPGSAIVLMTQGNYGEGSYGLADETGIASTAFSAATPRLGDQVNFILESQIDALESHQSHNIEVKRAGWGLRWDEKWE